MRAVGLVVCIGAAAGLGGAACGQTVELRIVERQGQVSLIQQGSPGPTLDNILNFAVQARVTGAAGVGLRSLTFNVVSRCEHDEWGTLNRLLTSNADGTYAINVGQATNNTVGRGGLAAQYTFAALSNPNANGLLNASGGGHQNNFSSQDVGLVSALAQGGPLLRAVDGDGNGIPDASPLNTGGQPVPDGSTAALDSVNGQYFFGSDGSWVDLYRFKYTRVALQTDSCQFYMTFQIIPVGLPTVFSTMRRTGGEWVAEEMPATGVTTSSVLITGCLGGPPHCTANYDGIGGIDVNDLFVYVADWFAGCDGSGVFGCDARNADADCDGVLSVGDLFRYIGTWFAGC